jgi:hAT family C-terminal dimerisation region
LSSSNIFDDLPALSALAFSELRDELDRYLASYPEQVTNVCQWWYERRVAYPRLSHMALDYLTIPGVYPFTKFK